MESHTQGLRERERDRDRDRDRDTERKGQLNAGGILSYLSNAKRFAVQQAFIHGSVGDVDLDRCLQPVGEHYTAWGWDEG